MTPDVLRAALDTALDAVVVTEAEPVHGDGPRIVWVNRAFERHTGWTLEEVLGRTPRLLQGEGTDRAVLDHVGERLRAWQDVDVELLNYRRDGTPFWVHLLITPLADETGCLTHWVSVQRDITERRLAELERERQAEFVTGVLSSMVSQTVVLDRHGVVVSANAAWDRFWQANGGGDRLGPGTDYLAACEAAGDGCGEGRLAAQGIRAVLEGRAPRFGLDYECSSPDREAWYHCEVAPLRGPDARLLPAGGCVVSHEDITERVLAERRLARRAEEDELTGLATRAALVRHLQQQRLLGRPASLLLYGLDGFKEVNESLGHDTGDHLLHAVADRLRGLVGGGELVARVGGDQFALTCPGDGAAGSRLAARLHEVARAPHVVAGTDVALSGSVGVAALGGDAGTVMAQAEAAMHRAKELGRSRTLVFSDDMHEVSGRRLEVLGRLRLALDGDPRGGRLLVHRQPITDLRTGGLRSWEALVRWERDGGLVAPAGFLPLIGGTDLAVELDLHVLRTVVRRLAAGPDEHHRVSVNAGALTLSDSRYLAGLVDELARTGLPASMLGVEVTEETAAADDVADVLASMRSLGVRVSLDDFGTGWSSLTNLVRLPVDALKVDRLFVERLGTSEGQAVVSAVVSMASALGLDVVAEGIETEEQRAAVLALGGTSGQGYLFDRPTPWA